jgi:hypothetical protein
MTKFIPLLIFTFLIRSISAQPIIDQNNFVNAGDVFTYLQFSNNQLSGLTDIQEEGEDIIWDFSALPVTGIELTNSYYPLDSTPDIFNLFFGNQFLAGQNFSNQALELSASDFDLPLPLQVESAYQFYRKDSDGYFITGNAAEVEGLPLLSAYDTLDRVYSFPLGFGDTDTNSFYFLTEIPGLGTFGQSGIRSNHVDAWGSLMLPAASYDCLRVRTELDITDTLYIDFTQSGGQIVRPRQINYTWISPEVGGIVAEAVFLEDSLISFRYLIDESALSSVVVTAESFQLFPNPASEKLNVTLPKNFTGRYKILDLTGRQVKKGIIESYTVIDIAKLPEGIYLVNIFGGETAITKRLVINR